MQIRPFEPLALPISPLCSGAAQASEKRLNASFCCFAIASRWTLFPHALVATDVFFL
jgi:hypothetical protein